ncbi:MAG: hypothetical protein K6A35_08195 [bacterium]|nr:hypothetical protein [bacterium]
MVAYSLSDMLGMWIGACLALFVFSFLYKDNPFYKLAEHIFVGVAAGYTMCMGYWQVIQPNLIAKLQAGDWRYLIAAVLSLMLLTRLSDKYAWLSRWPLAFMVGIFAGYNIVYTMQAQVLKQLEATILPLWNCQSWQELCQNLIVVVGVLTGLMYFYFSKEHKGTLWGKAARVGIWGLMITFGAAFGYTVMARISLLIGHVMYLQDVWRATLQFFGLG